MRELLARINPWARIRELESRLEALEQEEPANYAWYEMPGQTESINVPGPEGLWRAASSEYAGYVWEDDENGYEETPSIGVYL